MSAKRKIEVFGAGCSACDDSVAMIRRIACTSCEIQVLLSPAYYSDGAR